MVMADGCGARHPARPVRADRAGVEVGRAVGEGARPAGQHQRGELLGARARQRALHHVRVAVAGVGELAAAAGAPPCLVTPQTVSGSCRSSTRFSTTSATATWPVERLAARFEVDRLAPGIATRRRRSPAGRASSVRKSRLAGAPAASAARRSAAAAVDRAAGDDDLLRLVGAGARTHRLGQRGHAGRGGVERRLLVADRARRLGAGGAGRGRRPGRDSAADSARARAAEKAGRRAIQVHHRSVVRARRRFARQIVCVSNTLFTGRGVPGRADGKSSHFNK